MSDIEQDNPLNGVYKKSDLMIFRAIAGASVLVPLRKSAGELDHIFTLNETGSIIWNLLDGQRCLSDILHIILEEYETTETEATQDLIEVIAHLTEVRAVEQV